MASRARDLANLAKGNLTIDASGDLDVSGTVTADGLAVDGTIETINGTDIDMDALGTGQLMLDGNAYKTAIALNAQGANLYTNSSARAVILGTNETQRLRVQGNGDINFYDSTGVTQGFYWDASTQQLGLGTTAPAKTLDINTASATFRVRNSSGGNDFSFKTTAGPVSVVGCEANTTLALMTNNTERMRILSDGKVAIGSTASSEKLRVSGNIEVYNDDVDGYLWFHDTGTRSWSLGSDQSTGKFVISNVQGIDSGQKLSLDSSGNLVVDGSISATGGFVGAGGLPPTMQVFTSSGTWNRPTGCKTVKVTVVGGGGGAGATKCNGGNCRSGAGGGAGASIKYIDVTNIASVSVTRGNGGSGGSSSGQGNNGGNGGTSSFGSHCSASGGSGGNKVNSGGTDNIRTTGTFGSGSGGNMNIRGYCAGPGAAGGSILFGGGIANGSNHGASGQFGAGGTGSSFGGYNSRNGGAGGAGIIFVEEYY